MTKKIEKKNLTKTTKKNKKYETFNILEVSVLIIITVIVSLIMGSTITYNLNKNKINPEEKELKKFIDNYHYIVKNYYEDIDKEKILNNALNGMLSSLEDDYSYLIDENDSQTFNIQLEGEYEGIGIEIIGTTDSVIINRVFEFSPADKAGLKPGDIILKIDGNNFAKKDSSKISNSSEISKYIRNNKKNVFDIEIKRDNEIKKITIKREKVTIKAVSSKTYNKEDKKVGYIKIDIFSNIAALQFKSELEKLEKDNIDSLIIDVRNNSGGHLTTATKIISEFLDSKHIIYQTDTKGKIKKYYSSGNKTKKYPIAILQNNESASASEMLSASLKEEYGAIVVGEVSYGKGTVQELIGITNDIEYKITTKKWLTPKGNWINKKGVSVDYEVNLNEEYNENPTDENDNQLKKALEEIIKK